ncbi:hypothetical protein BayCH28_19300 [Mycolicibacterium sp. CH28]|nr:hypothetical protein BayCH28_19300 [Mycolicibacterium sp. CH28]
MSALAAALIGGVVACAAPSEAAPAGPGGPGDPFAACMTENGVPAPPQSGPGGPGAQPGSPPPQGGPIGQNGTPPAPAGVDQGVWDKGMQACASLAPAPPPQH